MSTAWKIFVLWVGPSGQLIACCDPEATRRRSSHGFALYKGDNQNLFEHNHIWTQAWPCRHPFVILPLSASHGSWAAQVPECL